MEGVEVYRVGLVYASVCVENGIPPEKIEEAVNASHPTGISSRWQISTDEHFASGEPNPCPCHERPETHSHYLLVC